MDGTEEGLAAAARVREAAAQAGKRVKAETEANGQADTEDVKLTDQAPGPKRQALQPRVKPPCKHEVQLPDGFDEASYLKSTQFDPSLHGGRLRVGSR